MHITVGDVVALLGVLFVFAGFAFVVAVAWRVSKGGGGGAVMELSEANKVLEQRLHDLRKEYQAKVDELGAQIRELSSKNDVLSARTDYEAVISKHEERAQKRHDAQLKVLQLIADRLGPDTSTA